MNLKTVLEKIGSRLEFSKSEPVFLQGDQDQSLYYVEKGLLKASYLSSDGRELIKSFLKEEDIIGSLISCVRKEPCTFTLVCLEDSELIRFPFTSLVQLSETNKEMSVFVMNFLMRLALKKENREYEFLCLDATERYRLLRDHQSDLLQRVTQNDIARYLGITPVALSRIRRKL